MEKQFIYFFGILLFLYLISLVPYCVPDDFNGERVKIEKDASLYVSNYSELILLHVDGNSMFPTIKDKSRCLCEGKNDYFFGDIVASVSNEQGILHRIISINDGEIFTKGDNNDFIDYPIKKEEIICRVPEVPRYVLLIKGLG